MRISTVSCDSMPCLWELVSCLFSCANAGSSEEALHGLLIAELRRRMTSREIILGLQTRIGQTVLGQEKMIERLVIGLLANGNLLVEGLPGLGRRERSR